jgi:hypothetical protein
MIRKFFNTPLVTDSYITCPTGNFDTLKISNTSVSGYVFKAIDTNGNGQWQPNEELPVLTVLERLSITSGAVSGYIFECINSSGDGQWVENKSSVDVMDGVNLDFSGPNYQTITISGDVTFTASNMDIGREASIKMLCDASGHALAFPTGWRFVGTAAPTTIAANKIALLSATCFGSDETDVVAAYAVEP